MDTGKLIAGSDFLNGEVYCEGLFVSNEEKVNEEIKYEVNSNSSIVVNALAQDVPPEGVVVELNPFANESLLTLGVDMQGYINEFSVIHAFVYDVRDLVTLKLTSSSIHMTDEDLSLINDRLPHSDSVSTPQYPLILCLIESFESWVITPEIMPNLCNFIQTHNQILYANKLTSQVAFGTSSDGQLISNTGLLPIQKGAVCFRYCYNTFPALSALYEHSCGIFPHGLSVWNQAQMSDAYGIDTNFVCAHYDNCLFSKVQNAVKTYDYVLMITSSTHNPFTAISDSSALQLEEDMPYYMKNYIKIVSQY